MAAKRKPSPKPTPTPAPEPKAPPASAPTPPRAPKPVRRDDTLTHREALFVLFLDLCEGNATEACERAGFSPNGNRDTLTDYAKRLMKRRRVRQAVELFRARTALAAGISVEGIKAKLWAAFQATPLEGKNVVKLGKLLAEMTPGGLVPRKLDVSGGLTLRELVAAAGEPEKDGE